MAWFATSVGSPPAPQPRGSVASSAPDVQFAAHVDGGVDGVVGTEGAQHRGDGPTAGTADPALVSVDAQAKEARFDAGSPVVGVAERSLPGSPQMPRWVQS